MVDMDMVILGSLAGMPAHGYQLKRNIESTFGKRYLNLSNSRLYPRLAKLESDGCIEGHKEPQNKTPDRVVYKVTPAGFVRLKELVAAPIDPRDDLFDFMSRAAFFGLITPEERRRLIEPMYNDKLEELAGARQKKEQYGQYMDKYSRAVLDWGTGQLERTIDLFETLMDLE
ncbi:MAG: PadR family transcriptional regulator [Dehalobacter sp.]|nr:PadR family transcriptional regulator [Dehalobacter sp.]